MNSKKIKRRENKRRPNTSPKIVRSNIYIACEGAKTERGYINLLNQRYNLKNTNLKPIKRKITKPNPIQVLDDLK